VLGGAAGAAAGAPDVLSLELEDDFVSAGAALLLESEEESGGGSELLDA